MSSTAADALDAFIREHGDALGRLAFHLTGDRERALDLVQDALVQALRRWEKVSAADHRLAYVRRMLVNQHLNAARRSGAASVAHGVDDAGPADRSAGPGAYDELDAMWRALHGLSPRQRAVLVLRYYEGCEDTEIASVLGCRRSTVRSLAARGLAELRHSPHLALETDARSRS